ncbi:MAG: class I SAM-dependent methyltransferase [Proteobacteria bacterium]|nr:class I SAM-dependent methyltransferase [Pseudomonadota bacterium]
MSKFPPFHSRRVMLLGAAAAATLGVAGCGKGKSKQASSDKPAPQTEEAPDKGTLQWAVAGDWRAADRPRDRFRHPEPTLLFFGLKPRMRVVEFWPGKGFWTEILAPYLGRNDGVLYAADFELGDHPDPAQAMIVQHFKDRFGGDRSLYGQVRMTEFGASSKEAAPKGQMDLALFMDVLDGWMAAGIERKAFRDAFAALKSGGILGVEQHRANAGGTQDPAASSGYVQEAYVKQLASEAGFQFVAASEVNSNPRDTKDHPFGVWTLPPTRLSAPRGQPDNPNFNHAKYDLIGESDRMTLKFRKP